MPQRSTSQAGPNAVLCFLYAAALGCLPVTCGARYAPERPLPPSEQKDRDGTPPTGLAPSDAALPPSRWPVVDEDAPSAPDAEGDDR